MARPRLKEETKAGVKARLMRIQPDTPRRWGTMTPTDLMKHLDRAIEISLGEVKLKDQSNFFTRTVVRFLAMHVIPFPKGIKAPAEFTPAPTQDFEAERAQLLATIDRFCARRAANPQERQRSPIFGNLTLDYWGHIHSKHFEHHFKQFGV